jgi:CTD kinase subunit gamma
MNTRVNILYFIETLCEQSLKADYAAYVKMIQRDLRTIVDAVAPNDPEGAANAETVKKVLYLPMSYWRAAWTDTCAHRSSRA